MTPPKPLPKPPPKPPPKPSARPGKVSLTRYLRMFRRDIISAQPEKLYGAWMAEFRTILFRSALLNQPDLVKTVLKERPDDFPKSDRVGRSLRTLLGNSVFVTNGETWKRQRRIIDPAFEGGRLRDNFAPMMAAGQAAVDRLKPGEVEIEAETSMLAADVIFRTLFSVPIDSQVARDVFDNFRRYQRSQPLLNLGALLRLPTWTPGLFARETRETAGAIRALIGQMTHQRAAEIANGTAPDDLATKIMTQADPQTGETFNTDEMIDQVAIFFLAGHETSASALAWALYLLATHPDWQDIAAAEAQHLTDFSSLSKLPRTRDIFRETLRLYPPVPMMVRENHQPETFRKRLFKPGPFSI